MAIPGTSAPSTLPGGGITTPSEPAQRVTSALAGGPPRAAAPTHAAAPPPLAGPPPAGGRPAETGGSDGPGKGYDIVFADPPYDLGEQDVTAMLDALVGHGWINAGGLVILERSKRSPEPTWVRSVTGERSRRYGEAMLWYGRRS